jgi:hypothetical protein
MRCFHAKRRVLSILIVASSFGCAFPQCDADIEAADTPRAQAAFRECLKAAQQGDRDAQFALGEFYGFGLASERDWASAVSWLRKAAEQGDARARNVLGWPFAENRMPRLSCELMDAPGQTGTPQIDSLQEIRVLVTIHNYRPVMETMLLAAVENRESQPREPNLELNLYRIAEGERTKVQARLFDHGGGIGTPDDAETPNENEQPPSPWETSILSDEEEYVDVRIPVSEQERQQRFDDLFALIRTLQRDVPEMVNLGAVREQLRKPVASSERDYFDAYLPNQTGVFELECAYKSQRAEFWQGSLVSPPRRFEIVEKHNWLDGFRNSDEQLK